jgi:hypothetical protein
VPCCPEIFVVVFFSSLFGMSFPLAIVPSSASAFVEILEMVDVTIMKILFLVLEMAMLLSVIAGPPARSVQDPNRLRSDTVEKIVVAAVGTAL